MSVSSGSGLISSADGTSILVTAGVVGSIDPRPNRLANDLAGINGTQATGLSIALKANTNYIVTAMLTVVAGAGATAQSFQVHTLAAGAAVKGTGTDLSSTGILNNVTYITAAASTFGTAVSNNTAISMVEFNGVITVGINATAFAIDQVDTGTSNNLKAGSYITAQVVV